LLALGATSVFLKLEFWLTAGHSLDFAGGVRYFSDFFEAGSLLGRAYIKTDTNSKY
jgi:hypothetical protein